MWNLFSVVQPKVLKPSKSLKQELLQQEAKSLQFIEYQAKRLLNSINNILKNQSSSTDIKNNQKKQFQQSSQLQEVVDTLYKKIYLDNEKFELTVLQRDQQKSNRQQFFKQTMRSYQQKKSQMNLYIQQLEEQVQKLQLKGYKTYQLEPKQNNVLNGISKAYIEKCVNKLEEKSKIEIDILKILCKNKKDKANKENQSNINQNYKKYGKISLISSFPKLSLMSDIEKQLQMILLKEEVLGDMLDYKIKNNQNNFKHLAIKEELFKEALKKQGSKNQEIKRKSSTINMSSTCKSFKQKLNSNLKCDIGKKASSFFVSKQSKLQQKVESLNPSFQQNLNNNSYQFRQVEQIQQNGFQPQIEEDDKNFQTVQDEEEEYQAASQNFIEACQDLITQRFVEDDEQQNNEKEKDQKENDLGNV